MSISKFSFNELICFLLPLAIGLTFPAQVIIGTSMAGMSSMVLLISLIMAALTVKSLGRPRLSKDKSFALWDGVAFVFVGVCFMDIPVSLLVFGSEPSASFSALYLVGQAGLIYCYFSRMATEREIRSFFAGMVAMGLVSGSFFIVESINKVAFGQTTEYTLRAHEYSVAAAGMALDDRDVNAFRVDVAYRSFGLLERHSTSALWMVLGYFSYLFLASERNKMRSAFAVAFLAMLVVQNFTGTVVFLAVTFTLYRGFVGIRPFVIPALLLAPLLFFADFEKISLFMSEMLRILQSQIGTAATFQAEFNPHSYSSLVLSEVFRYGREVSERPHQLILGFGLGTNPFYGTSGDVGFIESVMRLGLPLWAFLTWNMSSLMMNAIRADRIAIRTALGDDRARRLRASAAILASIWLMDLHYCAWIHKSVWPILFFAMAIARRVDSHAVVGGSRRAVVAG